jgi:DNA-binding LacI/PurR family transcriptional regulator
MALTANRSGQPSRPSIHDVARRAGVSPSTVTRTIKGMKSVSIDMADKVWDSLQELGYSSPSRFGTVPRNRLLGLVIAPLSEPHSAELMARFQERAAAVRYDVLTCSIGDTEHQVATQLKTLLDRHVEGVAVLILTPNAELTKALLLVDAPVICCDSLSAASNIAALSIDYGRGVREGVQHLARIGHREIAFIGSTSGCLATKQKFDAFLLALKEIGCVPENEWLLETDSSFTGGIAGAEQLLSYSHRPTAVVCSGEAVALGTLWALRHAGISSPDGLSLICLDECQFAEWMVPRVTTVEISIPSFAKAAFEALQNMIESQETNSPNAVLKVPTALFVRGSTSYPPGRALSRLNQASASFEQTSTL